MRRVKGMGASELNLVDMKKEFKLKFGAQRVRCFRLMKARNPFVIFLYLCGYVDP